MNKYKWTEIKPHGPASAPVELVAPDGTLCGVTLRTLENAWGQFDDRRRIDMEKRILRILNNGSDNDEQG